MKKLYFFTIYLFLTLTITSRAQEQTPDPSQVRLVNTGRMAVASNNGTTALYIPFSVKMADDTTVEEAPSRKVSILQQGITSIGGSFYQESASNVFQVGSNGWGTSEGTIVFSGDDPSGVRHIRTREATGMEAFERAERYVAFPNLLIATNDTIEVPGRMGMDAATITRGNGKTGVIHLHSDVYADKVYDASLRISAVGAATNSTSAGLVALGSVVVEKDISLYRGSTGLLFPFAAPFTNMRSGYYAGNFVRRLIEDANRHVTYVLGNKDADNDNIIDADQYVVKAMENFVARKGYLIKPRPAGFDFSNLVFLETTGTEELPTIYNKGMFTFDGYAYNLGYSAKQLFAEDELFHEEITGGNYDNTVNWIIGNSYTAAISMEQLKDTINNTGLIMSPVVYYYQPGSASYIPYNISASAGNLGEITDIPAMTFFMVRLSKGISQTGEFTIGRNMQTHGETSSNFLRAAKPAYDNELVFRVSPEENSNVYDLAMIALREKTSGSIAKIKNPDSDLFGLYAGSNMSVAILKKETESAPLGFTASDQVSNYNLSVSRVESMTTSGVWLEDRKTGAWIDLRSQTEYAFEAIAGELEERFIVHFTDYDTTTGMDKINQSALSINYFNGEVVMRGLLAEDLNAPFRISDVQGKTWISGKINAYPEERRQAELDPGVYLIHVGGGRNRTEKVVIK